MLAKVENPNWEIQDNSQDNKLVTVVQQSPVDGDSLEKTKFDRLSWAVLDDHDQPCNKSKGKREAAKQPDSLLKNAKRWAWRPKTFELLLKIRQNKRQSANLMAPNSKLRFYVAIALGFNTTHVKDPGKRVSLFPCKQAFLAQIVSILIETGHQ